MKTLVSTICIFYLSVGIGLSQTTQIDNHRWQTVAQDGVQFRVPDTWENDDDIWYAPDNFGTVVVNVTDDIDDVLASEQLLPNSVIRLEEDVDLPLGQALRIFASNETSTIRAYRVTLSTYSVVLIASIEINSPELEQIHFFAITEQIANTLQADQDNNDMWSLVANADATIFLRTPLSWAKQVSDSDTVSVSQLFDDVLVSVTYRDLGRPFELAEVEAQFATIYASNSYDIQAQEIVNLPIGDAIYFQLGDVRVTSSSTHIQLHYAIAYENYLLVVTAGADENYFAEYEATLRQIVDTLVFRP